MGLDSNRMWDCLETPDAAGMGLNTDAVQGQEDSVNPPHGGCVKHLKKVQWTPLRNITPN